MISRTFAHYEIRQRLGQGSMGIVYKAWDPRLNRAVALKYLLVHILEDPRARTRFLYEAQATAALQHPNIAVIYDYHESEGEAVIVMECVEGETLRQRLKQQQATLGQILDWAIEIADGLAAAHEKGITHRDIKPENIMILHAGGVKIMDFGVAKLRGTPTLTDQGGRVGTLDYASPELVMGGTGDHRSDIFSFGVVLYELLAGRCPFQGEHDAAIVYTIVNESPEPLRRFRRDIDPALERLVAKMLKKKPRHRYDRMDEVLHELKRIRVACTAEGRRTARRDQHRWLPLIFVSLAAIALVVLFGYAARKADPSRQEAGSRVSTKARQAWHVDPEPVLDWGLSGAWDSHEVLLPCVLVVADTLRMWYTGFDERYPDQVGQIGYAWSLDGKRWHRHPDNPVFSPSSEAEAWDSAEVSDPIVLYEDSVFRMWYSGRGPGDQQDLPVKVGYAVSPDGIHWTRHPSPVLEKGQRGEWDERLIAPDAILHEGDTLKMWYTGGIRFPFGMTQTGMAVSSDGMHWTKYDDPKSTESPYRYSDPVLTVGVPGAWDDFRTWNVFVRREEKGYVMWYTGKNYEYNPPQSIGLATSEDGIHWQKDTRNPLVFSDRVAPLSQMTSPWLISWQGRDWMWFNGFFGPTYLPVKIGLAVSEGNS